MHIGDARFGAGGMVRYWLPTRPPGIVWRSQPSSESRNSFSGMVPRMGISMGLTKDNRMGNSMRFAMGNRTVLNMGNSKGIRMDIKMEMRSFA